MLLAIKNVNKSYETHQALQDVSMNVPKGSIYGLLGPNGAGKTSLIRVITQITMPDSGEILFNNEPLAPKHVNQIGYMPEERGLYKKMRVGEQLLYLARLKGLSEKEAKEKLNYWFDIFEMKGWGRKNVEDLSKGMQQKVQFVATVLHEPPLLILDEPFSGFDPVNANLITKEILALRDRGCTIIFSTHRMDTVESLCDYIALINKSRKILEGKKSDIKQQFRSFTYSFVTQQTWHSEAAEITQTRTNSDGYIETTCKVKNNQYVPLITEVAQQTELLSFQEKIPTMDEIFINLVGHDVQPAS
ncbi:MAG: ATP-binding cassette domain-containing protein [Cytophagales bacterium]|nr:MAG: ATP-binding cassette domain-containing protein [Cytophagales bacterium]TAF59333.1 MAG: ATP-binding cassette domain-containing protein [Cytophagales bacterium]